jgi:DNA-binding HxlR family transcriptional regulator
MRPRASSVDSKAAQGQGKVEQKLRDHVVARTCRLADAMLRASSQHIRELWKISNTELRLLSTLENLESKKMVERRADPHDSRSIRVSLTRKGRQILEESRPYAQWSEECLLKGVDAKKLKELMDQLEANTQNMLSALAPFQKKHPKDQTNPS